jgi:hypothetical protein
MTVLSPLTSDARWQQQAPHNNQNNVQWHKYPAHEVSLVENV